MSSSPIPSDLAGRAASGRKLVAIVYAVDVQREVPAHEAGRPSDRRVRFRVGIDVGDVIADHTDLHGNGVIVAVRLQAVCPGGSVCVSRVGARPRA